MSLQPSPSGIPSAPRVAILISTYNGEKYITEQIYSILQQLSNDDRIFIRDDGSTDNTILKINDINDGRIIILESSGNIGFGKSFMRIIHEVPEDFNTYFLADQDDVWLQGKKEHAIHTIGEAQHPTMMCTRLRIVNSNLMPIGLSPEYKAPPSFRNAICQNIGTGCTMALNRSAIIFLKSIPRKYHEDSRLYYHDWWIYLNLSYFGIVIYDPNPSVLYRQHHNNQIGMSSGPKRYLSMINTILKKPWTPILLNQLNLFCEVHKNRIKADDWGAIEPLCHGNAKNIVHSFLRSPFPLWQRKSDAALFKVLIIFEMIRRKIPNLK